MNLLLHFNVSLISKNQIGKLIKLLNDIPTKLLKNFVVSFRALITA